MHKLYIICPFLYTESSGKQYPIVMIIYKFDGITEQKVLVGPHAQSSKQKPFYRTAASVKTQLAKALEGKSPMDALDKVTQDKGGLLGATSVGQIPRNRQQAYHLNHQRSRIAGMTNVLTSGKGQDVLYITMEQCKLTEKEHRFVREVTCAPEPMAVLATDQMLRDIERFSCSPTEFSILGINPTFNLGDFSVTPILYQHLLIVNAKEKSPWMLGPILIHYKKEFRNYNFFLSCLVGLRRSLANVQAVGTDGEKSLIDSIHHQFQKAVQLRCFRHLRGNIEWHLQEEKLPMSAIQKYVSDVFGADNASGIHHEGLVDCQTEDVFYHQLEQLKPVWDKRESDFGLEPKFHSWFLKYKADDFCSGALRGVRERAGLGCPPIPYFTNSNESINKVIKVKTQWKKNQFLEFIEKMKELGNQQQRDIEKSIMGEGEFTLKPQFNTLEVSQPGRWWRMNEGQRLACLKRFNECALEESKPAEVISGNSKGKEKRAIVQGVLIPTTEDASCRLSMPVDTVQGIWKKAIDLCRNPAAIGPMPGGGSRDCFVLSRSNVMPHAVTVKGAVYHCDNRCAHYQSLSLCSHTVIAAHTHGDLASFINSLARKKAVPNLYQLSRHGMPPGAGKKGNRLPRRKPSKLPVTGNGDSVALSQIYLPMDSTMTQHALPHYSTQSKALSPSSNPPTTQSQYGSSGLGTSPPTTQSQYRSSGLGTSPPTTQSQYGSSGLGTSPPTIQSQYGSSGLGTSPPTTQSQYGSSGLGTSPPTTQSQYRSSGLGTSPPTTQSQYGSSGLGISLFSNQATPLSTQTQVSSMGTLPFFLAPPPLTPLHNQSAMSLSGPPRLWTPPMQPSPFHMAPFVLMFISGQISNCFGCRHNFMKPATPSFDMVVQHKDYRSYTAPDGTQRSKYGNVYYHANLSCITIKQPQFHPTQLIVPQQVSDRVTTTHVDHLKATHGVTIPCNSALTH